MTILKWQLVYPEERQSRQQILRGVIKSEISKLKTISYEDKGNGTSAVVMRDALHSPSIDEITDYIMEIIEHECQYVKSQSTG